MRSHQQTARAGGGSEAGPGMTPAAFRRLALGFPGTIESAHMGHPDFRVNAKIFATIAPDNKQGMVKLTPEQQADVLREYPAMFTPAAGAWGRQGCTMVRFDSADAETVGAALTLAWQNVAKPRPGQGSRASARARLGHPGKL